MLHKNIDWEKTNEGYTAHFNLRVSLQNKETRELTEFFTGFGKNITEDEFNRKDDVGEMSGSMVVFPVRLKHWNDETFIPVTLREMLKQLEPGEYVVNVYLQHAITKKSNAWQEEITIG